jgi:mono/diheme cytochrome c family protein
VSPNIAGKSPAEVEQIGIGSYLVNSVGNCGGCHNSPAQQFLGGGAGFPLDAAGDIVFTRNLTPDKTTGLKLTEDQFITVFRTGKDFKITSGAAQQLIVMPWPYFRWLSTPDIKAIYAYLKSIPAVNNTVPPDVKGALSALPPVPFPTQYNDGDVARPLPPELNVQGGPAPDPDNVLRGLAVRPLDAPADLATRTSSEIAAIGRGSYLVNTLAHCNDCHTNPARDSAGKVNTAHYLTGGGVFPTPTGLGPVFHQTRSMSADLTGKTHGFLNEPGATFNLFLGIISSGQHIDDTPPSPLAWPMPWNIFQNMTLSDLEAVWSYLKTLPPIAGTATDPADKTTQGAAVYCSQNSDCGGAPQTCNTATNECIGETCTADADCGACQTCTTGACAAPASSSTCLANGI